VSEWPVWLSQIKQKNKRQESNDEIPEKQELGCGDKARTSNKIDRVSAKNGKARETGGNINLSFGGVD